jgi:mono/diheme cytochrome c family protein
VLASEDRLIKIVLNGLYGSIKVLGKQYPGQVPMTPQRGLLNDEEMAGVLTYVRNAFGNKASVIGPEKVKEIRAATTDKEGFYTPEELLEQHPDVLVN